MSANYQSESAKISEIVERLQQPDIEIDEAIKLYEQGLAAVKKCEELLTSAQNKITTLGKQ